MDILQISHVGKSNKRNQCKREYIKTRLSWKQECILVGWGWWPGLTKGVVTRSDGGGGGVVDLPLCDHVTYPRMHLMSHPPMWQNGRRLWNYNIRSLRYVGGNKINILLTGRKLALCIQYESDRNFTLSLYFQCTVLSSYDEVYFICTHNMKLINIKSTSFRHCFDSTVRS